MGVLFILPGLFVSYIHPGHDYYFNNKYMFFCNRVKYILSCVVYHKPINT